jgi:hypothetical protein
MAKVARNDPMPRRMERRMKSLLPKLASQRARRTKLPLLLILMILENISLARLGEH